MLDTVILRENTAPYSGGGIFVSASSSATIMNSLFMQNTAATRHVSHARGGAVCNEGSIVVKDSTFLSNIASSLPCRRLQGCLVQRRACRS